MNLDAEITPVGCFGLDFIDPWMELSKKGYPSAIYANVTPDVVEQIFLEYLDRDFSSAYAFRSGRIKSVDVPALEELDVWKHQVRWISGKCGIINPESIDEYVAVGGYRGLKKCLNRAPEETIEDLRKANIRGRGGAGFPTYIKWNICKDQQSDVKYVIANCDEGDPGAFMNRLLAESDPHRILEGLIIAGHTIGARKGFIFVRAEKPLAAKRLLKAAEDAREKGYLGGNILGTGFCFDIDVFLSAGAFVCGEETAMIAAIQGERANPIQRPPFPAVKGLWGMPTIINNVETLAHVATIMAEGWEKFAALGTEKSRGTKMYCVTGAVKRTGAYEVPVGTPIKTLIYDLAGGPPKGKFIKAVQLGGPSGGCVPANMFNLPMDYDSLQSAGAIMGSGGMVVLDNTNCMVDMARYFVSFTAAESCGKCSVGRIGTRLMHETLKRITCGQGTQDDIELLKETSDVMQKACLCALGRTASNPILTTLRYFEKEYSDHINEKKCEALVCKPLLSYRVDTEKCKGCMVCVKSCPVEALSGEKGSAPTIDQLDCVKCGTCADTCPFGAIEKVAGRVADESLKVEEDCC
jgi:NADH:ubiquinone oxidoreductase subunit F (NADH-binding)/NAD-dependent dihydropyrimidine dehydrogenase PreA subunit/(2Fe-2S) ferredoxin